MYFTYRVDTRHEKDTGDDLGRLTSIGAHGGADNQRDQDGSTQHGQVMLQSEQQAGSQRRNIGDGIAHAILHGTFLVRLDGSSVRCRIIYGSSFLHFRPFDEFFVFVAAHIFATHGGGSVDILVFTVLTFVLVLFGLTDRF